MKTMGERLSKRLASISMQKENKRAPFIEVWHSSSQLRHSKNFRFVRSDRLCFISLLGFLLTHLTLKLTADIH